jgi:acyl carrier protein
MHSQKIRWLQKIEKNGTEVNVHTVDINNRSELGSIFEQAHPVEGIFHLAGKVGQSSFKTISEMRPEDWESQFNAKVNGLLTLADLATRYKPAFCILQSSLSAVLGGLGFGAYAAANSFMDTFAASRRNDSETRWLSLNWEGWNFEEEYEAGALGSETARLAVRPEEGMEAFKRLFSMPDHEQIIISTADLNQRIKKWLLDVSGHKDESPAEVDKESKYARPNLPTPLVEPETDLQKEIASIWQQLLSIDAIGIHDDFFDLGGNSLLGTQLISKMRDHFQVDLPLRSLFEDPTIAAVAELIEKQTAEKSPEVSKISDMLQQLEGLSEEEAARMLKERKKQD